MKAEHRAAGYHKVAWKTPKKDSDLIGRYDTHRGVLVISHLKVGPAGGEELLLQWNDGMALTVMCEDVARDYLRTYGAVPSA